MSMEQSKSLAPHTGQVFEAISKLECIKPFTLSKVLSCHFMLLPAKLFHR